MRRSLGIVKINPNKAGLFEGRTYLISMKLYTIVKQSI